MFRTKNITSMAMVKILCDLNKREKAFKTLANVTNSFLLSWSKANPQFLLSRDSSLTLLGQVRLILYCVPYHARHSQTCLFRSPWDPIILSV